MVEEANARDAIGLAGAVQVQRQLNLGLGGLAVDGGGAWHENIRRKRSTNYYNQS